MNASPKPRVVILSCFLTPFRSGAESCAEEVALRLCEEFDVTIVTARLSKKLPKEEMLQGKVPVVRVGLGYAFDKWLYPFLAPFTVRKIACHGERRRTMTKERSSLDSARDDKLLIHAVLETFAGLALHLCKFVVPSAKRLLTMQTTNRSLLKKMITLSPDAVTAISSALIDIAKGFGRTDITRIPNGLNLDSIPQREKVPGRILFVGRLETMKGIDTLLRAFAKLPERDVHLRIVGEGSERVNLEKLSAELGIADRVTFVGFVPIPDVYEEFAKAEIFCGLSRSEALGNVFLEAMAAECAVIGTRVGGIPDMIEHQTNGLLVPPNDAETAADALHLLLSDASLRNRFVEQGKSVAEHSDWNEIAERYKIVYRALIDTKNQP